MNEAPQGATQIESVQWIILFGPQEDELDSCIGDQISEVIEKDFILTDFKVPEGRLHVNQTDIVLRSFPPQKVGKDDIRIYKRK